MINNISTYQTLNTVSTVKTQNKTEKTDTKETEKKDRLEIKNTTKSTANTTYKTYKKMDVSDIAALKREVDKATENLRSLVEKLILRQSKKTKSKTDADAQTIEEAKQAVSEDGEYGVKAVSDRIVNFAIAISGGDKTKLGELKAAIDKGFEEAKKAFGGELPDICGQTHDEIMKKLDDWASEDQKTS